MKSVQTLYQWMGWKKELPLFESTSSTSSTNSTNSTNSTPSPLPTNSTNSTPSPLPIATWYTNLSSHSIHSTNSRNQPQHFTFDSGRHSYIVQVDSPHLVGTSGEPQLINQHHISHSATGCCKWLWRWVMIRPYNQ